MKRLPERSPEIKIWRIERLEDLEKDEVQHTSNRTSKRSRKNREVHYSKSILPEFFENYRILTTEEKCESSYSKSLYQKIVNMNLVIPRCVVIKVNTKEKEKNLAVKEKRCNLHRNEITLVADLKTSVQSRR